MLALRRFRRRAAPLLVLAAVGTAGEVRAAEPACTDGRAKSADTRGHCCWQGQVWSSSRNTCVGVPLQCPAGLEVKGDNCLAACADGLAVGPDTQGHCCWPSQVWSSSRAACVGIPTACPPGKAPSGETCAVVCPQGQVSNDETQGHCCWPAQVWSSGRSACVGIPAQCPAGQTPRGETCEVACSAGQRVGSETQGHCCWPGQVWASSRAVCVGRPTQCPPGLTPGTDACVAQAEPQPPPVVPPPPLDAPPPPPPSEVAAAPAPAPAPVAAPTPAAAPAAPPANAEAQAKPDPSVWNSAVVVLADVSSGKVGMQSRLDIPFRKKTSTPALVIAAALMFPNLVLKPGDKQWVFPVEVSFAYRIGLGSRVQLIPRAGLEPYYTWNGSTNLFGFKALVGTQFRFQFSDAEGAHAGLIAGLEVLIPLYQPGWVVMGSLGFTL
ncbi:MAG: hypothetical protein IPJ65_43530 [Archangiaceae bacterium]|nr:hypothetical protein [Archangiaceae bacterium]